ncbi:MAG: J domain-containing protein [Terracidiphilus sp.]
MQQSQQSTQFNSSRYAASRPAYAEGFATNAHQTSQDRSEASPRGNETSHQPNQPMTLHLALQILEVTATSTQSEIKSAYRRLVNEWHPDRFEGKSERARQLATTKMSAINKAYQFLRNTL